VKRLTLLLVALALALTLPLAGCGGGDEEGAGPETVEGTMPTETGAAEGNAENGQAVFASAGCGGCHVFEAAGSSGTVGPSLDEADLDFDEVVEQVRNGGGGMPAFEGRLSEQEIADVAAFVTQG
jgi:mono/diheme cytochrome c family protein